MSFIYYIILFILLIHVLRGFFLNLYYWFRIRKIAVIYEKYIKAEDKDITFEINKYKRELIELFTSARIKNCKKHVAQVIAPLQYIPKEVDFFENLTFRNSEIASFIMGSSLEAEGVYQHRIFKAIHPIFWLEFLIFLPQNCVSYLGLNKIECFLWIGKLGNFVYWIILFIIALLKLYDQIG